MEQRMLIKLPLTFLSETWENYMIMDKKNKNLNIFIEKRIFYKHFLFCVITPFYAESFLDKIIAH